MYFANNLFSGGSYVSDCLAVFLGVSPALTVNFSPSHLEGSSTSVGRPGHCQSPVIAVENVDVRQRILFDVPPDGVHVS